MITTAPPQRAGAASALAETAAEGNAALGIAVFGSLGAAMYAAALATLGGTVASAASLPGATGSALLAAAHDAFSLTLQMGGIGAALSMLAAWAITRHLLQRSPASGSGPAAGSSPLPPTSALRE